MVGLIRVIRSPYFLATLNQPALLDALAAAKIESLMFLFPINIPAAGVEFDIRKTLVPDEIQQLMSANAQVFRQGNETLQTEVKEWRREDCKHRKNFRIHNEEIAQVEKKLKEFKADVLAGPEKIETIVQAYPAGKTVERCSAMACQKVKDEGGRRKMMPGKLQRHCMNASHERAQLQKEIAETRVLLDGEFVLASGVE